ncbi:family 43 glycosylhydrolase [Motilibacter sp. E257]|uniref:Family 43 glycosylhydrolase n=2 Tax=Motilibacter deserti TaxID=2714956 RepID=A0ABX0GRD1_9ACTN|nr:family 43 glycosylhydrolase [Motilibacter deserti]NHC13297.1 family 43 glycosylhydrolase [Motilibacter deserti]
MALLGGLALSASLVTAPGAATAAPAGRAAPQAPPATYTNPVTAGTVDTLPDPTMVRAKDGAWYAYGTTNPIFSSKGETREHFLPILRSTDMVTWTYAGDVFAQEARPSWWRSNTRAWAPDIRYLDGRYYLTYSLSTSGIGLATSDSPTGPWTDRGQLVPPNSGCPSNAIDQALFTDSDGTHYLYWGSYDTICVSAMNATATALRGPVTQIARGRRAEGGFVVNRGGWYYLFYSDGGCCDGAFSGYTVKVGRSKSPRGPFLAPDGQDLMDLRSHAGIVAAANGNTFVGPGHNAITTDLAGQDWLVYHGIPSATPDFPPLNTVDGVKTLSQRPLLIDRLDWIGGWPVLRAGAGPSDTPQAAPVTTGVVQSGFETASLAGWRLRGGKGEKWSVTQVPDAGGVLTQTGSPTKGLPALLTSDTRVNGDSRVEADLRITGGGSAGAVGLVVSERGNDRVTAWLDRGRKALLVSVSDGKKSTETSAPLPAGFDYDDWHNVAVEVRGHILTAQVSEDRLGDPLGTVTATVPDAGVRGRVGVASLGTTVQADNLSAADLYVPVTERVDDPQLGPLLPAYSDDFDGTGRPEAGDPAWTWVRGAGAANAVKADGALTWPTQNAEIYTTNNTASVLTRPTPAGDYVVEAKLAFNGTRGNQQAGILLYENDDRWFKLAHSVLPLTGLANTVLHQTEFGKEAERPTTVPATAVFNGPMFGGPPAVTTWLRLAYHYDAVHNENEVRMATSTDGSSWTWGGVWTMPKRGDLKIGLVSMNASGALATFDYVHTYPLK